MGWFWGSSNQNDPTKKLDPELRDFLKNERPAQYTPTTAVKPLKDTTTPADADKPSSTSDSKPQVPAASLFPDGRYAHIWKHYKPLAEIEGSSGAQSAEKVIEKFKQRNDTVHNAAMENCAFEHEALSSCFSKGDWWTMAKARATMCSDENRKFSRCYTTQAKFLQALGYAASLDWNEEKEERIQLHADKLYHQMLDYERRVDEARASGVEPPPLKSLFNPDARPVPGPDGEVAVPGVEELPAGCQPSKSLEGLTPHERELEIQSMKAELAQKRLYAEEASPYLKTHLDARLKRQQKAVSWFGETIGKWIT